LGYNAGMNAEPILREIARALDECGLEAVLIGNAAAALQGAPVTTLDFDFMFRKTPANLKRLKRLAQALEASIYKPFYPASGLFRLVNEEQGIQIDFMSVVHGVRSFEGLKSRASSVSFHRHTILVADLKDIIRSKRALGRPRDLAVLDILERTFHEKQKI